MGLYREGARTCSARCRKRVSRRPRFPESMTSRDRWLRWKIVRRNGRDTKMPLTVRGDAGSSTNATTWSSFADASASSAGVGLGYVLGDGIGAYDYDDALVDGKLAGWARDHVEAIPEPVIFMEVSQSGEGVHVFVETDAKKGRVIRDGRNIEFYPTGRYMAVTGVPFKL